MSRFLIPACAAALALGCFATPSQALVPAPILDEAATLAIPVADEEEEAVEQALEPEEMTEPAAGDDMSDGDGADVEEEELKMEEPAMDLPED